MLERIFNRPSKRFDPPQIVVDIESFDLKDLTSGPLVWRYAEPTFSCGLSNSLAEMLESASWWTRLIDPGLLRAAASRLRILGSEFEAAKERANSLQRELDGLRASKAA